MNKFQRIGRLLWLLLFFCQVFLGGLLIFLAPTEDGRGVQLASQAESEISPVRRMLQDGIALTKVQQRYFLQHCSGLEETLAAHVQFERTIIKNIREIIAIFVCFLALSALIQIAIIFVGRKQKYLNK